MGGPQWSLQKINLIFGRSRPRVFQCGVARSKRVSFREVETVFGRHQNHVIPGFKKFTEPYKKKSDLIINNDSNIKNAVQQLNDFLIKDYNKYKRLLS